MKSSLFYNSFNAIESFQDKHRAIAWKSLYSFIPESGPYTYSWYITASKQTHNTPDLEYKEFKSSIVNNALKEGKYGFIRLLLLSDKTIVKASHLPMLFGSRSLFEKLGDLIPNIKMPTLYNAKVENILLQALNCLNSDMDTNLNRKNNNSILDFLNLQVSVYGEQNNIGQKLLPIISSFDVEKINIIKNSGLVHLLSHNKMNHDLSSKDSKSKAFKL